MTTYAWTGISTVPDLGDGVRGEPWQHVELLFSRDWTGATRHVQDLPEPLVDALRALVAAWDIENPMPVEPEVMGAALWHIEKDRVSPAQWVVAKRHTEGWFYATGRDDSAPGPHSWDTMLRNHGRPTAVLKPGDVVTVTAGGAR